MTGGVSSSTITKLLLALPNPAAAADTFTVRLPSWIELLMNVSVNDRFDWPAGTMTVDGTDNCPRGPDARATAKLVSVMPVRRTCPPPTQAPRFSMTVTGSKTESPAISLSKTVTVALPSIQFCTRAVTVALRGPSISRSLTTAAVNGAVVWPAGITTIGGT